MSTLRKSTGVAATQTVREFFQYALKSVKTEVKQKLVTHQQKKQFCWVAAHSVVFKAQLKLLFWQLCMGESGTTQANLAHAHKKSRFQKGQSVLKLRC